MTSGTAIVLGGNLGGVTSLLLGLDGGRLAERLLLDAIYPVNGFKRCVDGTYGFSFRYPAAWLADQTVAYRAAQRAEAQRSLDLPPLARPPRQRPNVYEPVAAYGPAGSSGETNVSVIVAPIYQGFQLTSMGSPEKVATQFLATIAPEGSPRTAQLFAASARTGPDGSVYYSLEYSVQGPTFHRRNVAVIVSQNDQLFTFNAQCPVGEWEEQALPLRQAAQSFTLSSSGLDTTGFPDKL